MMSMLTSANTRRNHILQTTLYTIYTFTPPDKNYALAHKRWALSATTDHLMKALNMAHDLAQRADVSRVEIKKRWHCQVRNQFQEETVRIYDGRSRGLRGLLQTVFFWFRQLVVS